MTKPQDVVCFDVSIPEQPHLLFWWTRDGVDQCKIGDDGVIHLYNGVTVEEALIAAARVIGDAQARRTTVDEAMREIGNR